jgi:hypothetical protein
VVLLAQISQQLGPNGSQTIIPPLQPLEQFILNPSDLRVNIFWYMSLGFSITAALGATLVQQWVRDYLQLFQRLSGSLERSRLRQYLFHGLSSNHMALLVEFIPIFIHISLFLFFIGLATNLFDTNHAVAITTIIIIGFCAAFYIAFSVFPVLYPQTPFQTPLSKAFWIVGQHILPRKHSDSDTEGKNLPVSSRLAKGRLQLAMGCSNGRMEHDTEAIHWVISKITEDSEFEPFADGFAGSLATPWGRDIWKCIFGGNTRNLNKPLTRYIALLSSTTVERLKIRIESLLRSVSTHSNQQTRFTRACICIDAVASLTVGFSAELELDIDNVLLRTVLHFYGDERSRRAQANQVMDASIEIKWKCLILSTSLCQCVPYMPNYWIGPARCLDTAFNEDGAMTHRMRDVDDELLKAWKAAGQLYSELRDKPEEQWTEDRLNELVPHWRDHIDGMEASLSALNERVDPSTDSEMVALNTAFLFPWTPFEHLEGIIFYKWPSKMNLPAMWTDINWGSPPPEPSHWFMPLLIPPRLLICHLLHCADPRRRPNFDPSTTLIDLVGLAKLLTNPELQRLFDTQRPGQLEIRSPQPFTNQLWRFQDICKDRGVGFMVEMFFATFRSLKGKSMTEESGRLVEAALRAIIGNGRSEYFKTARIRFLWSLEQELEILRYSNSNVEPQESILRELFDESYEEEIGERNGGGSEK